MKPALLLLPVLALTACDKPTSTADFICLVDKYWESADALYVDSWGDFKTDDTAIDVKITTFDNYAKLTANNITTTFEKIAENKFSKNDSFRMRITYKGNFPGSERTALLRIYADIANKQIFQYDLDFIGQKIINKDGKEFGVSHSCVPVKPEYKGKLWNASVPFNHNYTMPTKVEQCIMEICDNVYCGNDECNRLAVNIHGEFQTLSQADAILLSKNWDYSNMKRYLNDGKLEEHEKDACEVLDRLKTYMENATPLPPSPMKQIQKAMDDCGDDCRKVIATGEMDDFLIRLPETPELREIANSNKNAMFLSVHNPNQFSKDGYCLINIVPFNTMKKLGMPENTCNYRIYCGSPEFMNYDEFYAVEVCD